MGGSGSGRYGQPGLVEAYLSVAISQIMRKDGVQPGMHVGGSLTWTSRDTGEETAALGYEARVGETEAGYGSATRPCAPTASGPRSTIVSISSRSLSPSAAGGGGSCAPRPGNGSPSSTCRLRDTRLVCLSEIEITVWRETANRESLHMYGWA